MTQIGIMKLGGRSDAFGSVVAMLWVVLMPARLVRTQGDWS